MLLLIANISSKLSNPLVIHTSTKIFKVNLGFLMFCMILWLSIEFLNDKNTNLDEGVWIHTY